MNLKGNKTTWIGILTIVAGVVQAALSVMHNQPLDIKSLTATLGAGATAIMAADSKQ